MRARAERWWRDRTLREQRLLLVMLVLLATLAAWLLVARPLGDALDAAQRRHAEAVTALADARARAAAAQPARRAARAAPLPVDAFLRRAAGEAGFANARIAAAGPTRATLALGAARPQAFFAFVRRMEQGGLAVQSLRARANSDRTIAVEAMFRAHETR